MKKLVVLVADSNIEAAVAALISRHQSLLISPLCPGIDFQIYRHPERDSGCFQRAHEFLRPFINSYKRSLVVFDHDFDKSKDYSRQELELSVEKELANNGWNDRSAAVVISPELENWVFVDSPHLDNALGFPREGLKNWLAKTGYWKEGDPKPKNPKEALEVCLRRVQEPRSSSFYSKLAEKVGLTSCKDQAFKKFRKVLQDWFPQENQ